MKLTGKDLTELRHGARHRDGVIKPDQGGRGFGRRNADARMAKLVAAGLAVPNVHGDWYITDAGRQAVAAAGNP